jgi:hypothetical protein
LGQLEVGLVGGDNYRDVAGVVVGGQPRFVPVAFFVPRETAWEVVKEFYATGKRSNGAGR